MSLRQYLDGLPSSSDRALIPLIAQAAGNPLQIPNELIYPLAAAQAAYDLKTGADGLPGSLPTAPRNLPASS